ncbi:MAG: L,D-transpeptidase [Bradyrhizobium sp.]|uniref:L,D-transpeptidase n=1 Tax=Bradyrhizobium sp. TaxID=376 RepID=UPI001D7A4D26|nr:L,D-transpeptidase [Bradyrhizobium sp.]MBV9563045.1 L,D-transpeptidase [Bradyrhizobium sp.]
MTGVNGLGVPLLRGRFWCMAVVAAAGSISACQAQGALYYWYGDDGGYSRPAPRYHTRQNAHRHTGKKTETALKESAAKPQGPLIIAVSVSKQQVKIYDDTGVFAQAPVSTGMAGHATPMGVFSVIQKQKWHQSNIYSGAPMPYMQRITWSGVAMHAGVLPGYPASHGCIRMPAAFAVKMYGWTRMGARVIVAPGEIAPESFSHALLPAMKVVPQPAVAQDPPMPATPKADKGASLVPVANSPMTSEARLELRPTVGHGDTAKADAGAASSPLRYRSHTADASGNLLSSLTLSDVSSTSVAMARAQVADADAIPPTTKDSPDRNDPVNDGQPAQQQAGTDAGAKAVETPAKADDDNAKSEHTAGLKSEEKPADTKADIKADPSQTPAPRADAEAAPAPSAASKPDAVKSAEEKPDGAKADSAQPTGAPDPKKDQTRIGDAVKPALSIPEIPKGKGQIAVFVSRKDSKLYVRQNFAPLFDVPVTIAASDRPLGTHVFTAETDKTDSNLLHWSVLSLPVSVRSLMRHEDGERSSRHRKDTEPAEAKPLLVPDSPAEALDRITIPPEVMTRIAEAMTAGGSIIVSDQGINQGETGEGTDFIISLR